MVTIPLRAPAIGLALILIHLIGSPVSNTSVNPALGLGSPGAGAGCSRPGLAVQRGPLVGAVIAGASHATLTSAGQDPRR